MARSKPPADSQPPATEQPPPAEGPQPPPSEQPQADKPQAEGPQPPPPLDMDELDRAARIEEALHPAQGRAFSVYHTSGIKCELPISQYADYGKLLAAVDRMLAAGWRASLPGAEPGEDVQEIGAVCWRKVDSRQSENGYCPRVDLYSTNSAMKWAVISIYLNSPEEEDHFDRIAGLKLAATPEYIGQGKLERGNRQTDRLITTVRPFKVVLADNPHYDPAKAEAAKVAGAAPYTVAKRVFVRFLDGPAPASKPANGQPASTAGGTPPTAEQLAEEFTKFLITVRPDVDEFNTRCKQLNRIAKGPHLDRAVNAMKEYGADKSWTFAPEKRLWIAPPPEENGDIPF